MERISVKSSNIKSVGYDNESQTLENGRDNFIAVTYLYVWGNNSKRETLCGRECRVLYRGKPNSAKVEFLDNGQIEIISRNALRRAKCQS